MKKPEHTNLGSCERGVAATEFALALPFLLVFLLGSFELSRYIIMNQKLDHVAYTTADVIGQEDSVNAGQVNDIMTAATQIMEPFGFGEDGIVIVSSVEEDPVAGPIIRWQCMGGGTLDRESLLGEETDVATLPDGFTLNDGENVIIAEVFYSYTPVLTEEYLSTRENYKFAIFKPRYGALTTDPGC